MDNELVRNIERVHTTELGKDRIRKNLSLENTDVVEWCKKKIKSKNSSVTRKGKNWYVKVDDCMLVVNTSSYTIITAYKIRK